jgi:DHA2 family multidrug resistance protein
VFVIFCLFSGLFIFTIYLQTIRGLSAFQAGLILLPQALASMVSVIIGGRLVDRIGVRAVMIPGLLILALATWQLTLITTYSPYWWIQVMFILRGLALGLTIQPLTVAMMAEVRSQQLAQASSLNTVGRAVSSSLGIAIIATLVQTQTAIHFGHLAEQVTASSPLGQLLPQLEAYFVAHGASLQAARSTALQLIAGLLQRQSFVLAVHDALILTLFVIALAIIATLFVRASRRPTQIQQPSLSPVVPPQTQESEASRAEAIMAG